MKKNICVVGEGAWGTALAALLADNGHTVRLWCHDQQVAHTIATTRENVRYAKGIKLSERIEPVCDIAQALADVEWVFCTTPVSFLRAQLLSAHAWYHERQTWIMLNKGIEQKTFHMPTDILSDVFGNEVRCAVVYGPSFAQDVLAKQPTGFLIASASKECADEIQEMLKNSYIISFLSADVMGAQLCAALKNVIAVGIGILDGAGYTDNTKALFFTCGVQEMAHLVGALGGQQQTAYSLAGVGDLVLSAWGNLGRNVDIGRKIGSGATLQQLAANGNVLPEGINTIPSVYQLMQRQKIVMPVHQALYRVIIEGDSPTELIDVLMNYEKN